MRSILLPGIVLFLLTVSSCSKPGQKPDENSRPENFEDIEASDNFDWNTFKHVEVTLTGFPAQGPQNPGVLIIRDDQNRVVYKGTHTASETFTHKLSVPALLTAIRVQYGVTDKVIPIDHNTVNGSLLPQLPQVD